MAFHPKQIPEFFQSRLGILLVLFLVGGFALAFYSFGNRQVQEKKNEESHTIDKLSQAAAVATPTTSSEENSPDTGDTDTNTSQRVYPRTTVDLPSLPPPPPPSTQQGIGSSSYNPLHHAPPPQQQIPPLMVAHYGGSNGPDQISPGTGGSTPQPPAPPVPVEGPSGQFEGDFAPFGRLLKCELVNTVDTSDSQTPIIAFVTDDLWWNGKLIIPAGTEVHGQTAGGSGDQDTSVSGAGGKATPQNPSSGGTLRDRVPTGSDWILVMPPYEEAPNGAELLLSGIALDRENLTDDDSGGWAITDGSYGIKGKIIDDLANERIIEFLGTFIDSALPVLETQNVYASSSSTGSGTSTQFYTTPKATVANAAEQGLSAAVKEQVENITAEIKRTGHYVRATAGRQFYLYITQTIDPTDARIGANFKQHSVPGAVQKFSPPSLYKSFIQSLGKPASSIVPPSQVVAEQNDNQAAIMEQQAALNAQKEQQEAQLQGLVSRQDQFMRILSQTQRQAAASGSDSMAPSPNQSNP